MVLLLLFQAVQVAILWTHDWIPLGVLNDHASVRRRESTRRLVLVTLLQSVPFTVGLIGTAVHLRGPVPDWLRNWLWASYLILFAGELRAWWWPYLVRPEPVRAERYAALFGTTHSFLPMRGGLVPNTLHCLLHLATAATLVALAIGPL